MDSEFDTVPSDGLGADNDVSIVINNGSIPNQSTNMAADESPRSTGLEGTCNIDDIKKEDYEGFRPNRNLEAENKSLKEKLAKITRDLKSAKSKYTQARLEKEKIQRAREVELKKTKCELQREHAKDLAEKEEIRARSTNTEEEIEKLRKANEKLKEKIQSLKIEKRTAQEGFTAREAALNKGIEDLKAKEAVRTAEIECELRPELERLREKEMLCQRLQDDLHTLKDTIDRMNLQPHHDCYLAMAERNKVEKELAELKKWKVLVKELIEIAIAVRLRFLEQAKEGTSGNDRGVLNQSVIREGNYAAHGGNFAADSALFKLGILAGDHPLADTLEDLYGTVSINGCLQGLWLRVMNCSVTCRTLKRVRSGNESATEARPIQFTPSSYADMKD